MAKQEIKLHFDQKAKQRAYLLKLEPIRSRITAMSAIRHFIVLLIS